MIWLGNQSTAVHGVAAFLGEGPGFLLGNHSHVWATGAHPGLALLRLQTAAGVEPG